MNPRPPRCVILFDTRTVCHFRSAAQFLRRRRPAVSTLPDKRNRIKKRTACIFPHLHADRKNVTAKITFAGEGLSQDIPQNFALVRDAAYSWGLMSSAGNVDSPQEANSVRSISRSLQVFISNSLMFDRDVRKSKRKRGS